MNKPKPQTLRKREWQPAQQAAPSATTLRIRAMLATLKDSTPRLETAVRKKFNP